MANKIDLLREEDEGRLKAVKKLALAEKSPFFAISAMKEDGLRRLVTAMDEAVAKK